MECHIRQIPCFHHVLIVKSEHIQHSAQGKMVASIVTSASGGNEWEDRIQPPVMYKGKRDCSLANMQIFYSANLEDA